MLVTSHHVAFDWILNAPLNNRHLKLDLHDSKERLTNACAYACLFASKREIVTVIFVRKALLIVLKLESYNQNGQTKANKSKFILKRLPGGKMHGDMKEH